MPGIGGGRMAFWNRRKKKGKEESQGMDAEGQGNQEESQESDAKAYGDEKESQGLDTGTLEGAGGIQQEGDEQKYQPEIIKPVYKNDRKRYVEDCCQAIQEAERQITSIRQEYTDVTESLLDIQKIDRTEGEEKDTLLHAAKNIIKLTRERNKYKNRNLTISEVVMRRFEPYEKDLVDEIKKMYEAEAYQKAIDGDIDKLQGEKQMLREERQEIVEKQNALKGMAKVLIVLILSLFILFIAIYYAMEVDMTLPYLGTVFLAAVSATALFVESNRNHKDMALADRKMDKATGLLNRVKIKCVNNLNLLDYSRAKFGVGNAAEFESLWNEYIRVKEYERKFRENTEQLNYYCDSLLRQLKARGVADCEVWIGQAPAIADSREMVEIRHKLNQQRQILRERIEYNEAIKNDFLRSIDGLIQENPESREELLAIVARYSS